MSEYIVRSKASTFGDCGNISKRSTVELYPDHCVVVDANGRRSTRGYHPPGDITPEVRARQMVATGLYEPVGVPAGAKLAPAPGGNKMARAQENKGA